MTLGIIGRVIDRHTLRGESGLRVEAWVSDPPPDEAIRSAETDEEGTFQMEVEEDLLLELFQDRPPEVFFRVFRGDELVTSTEDSVVWRLDDPLAEVVIEVDLPVEDPIRRVTGEVRGRDGTPAAAVIVRALDQDLGDEEPLDEAVTDETGFYAIQYSIDQLRPLDKRSADLIVRVFSTDDEHKLLGTSETVFDVPADARIDVVVELPTVPELSEYEQLVADLTPVLGSVRLADLSDEEVTLLAERAGVERSQLAILVQAAKLAQETNVPLDVLYGLAREDLPASLEGLLALGSDALRGALESAIERKIIPAAAGEDIETILRRFEWLQGIHTPLELLAPALDLDSGSPLFAHLAERGISTLLDVRNAGGIGHLQDLPVPASDPAVRTLEAQANLSVLSSDVQLNTILIRRGFTSPLEIAETPRPIFVAALSEALEDFKAAEIHAKASAGNRVLQNALSSLLADAANGHGLTADGKGVLQRIRSIVPEKCGCEECEAAVSPLAYLADLLGYAVQHLQNEKKAINFRYLTDNFHQPFGDLPASCEQMDRQERQVRLCVEVLRRYLKAKHLPAVGSPQASALETAERDYRLQAYRTLLTSLGASYDAIRLARAATPDERQALADRLGIALTQPRPASGDELDRMFLDPAAASASPHEQSEQALERLFGLADTTRDPLSEGAKRGDSQGQIRRWNLDGVKWGASPWGSNTDLDGTIYVSLTQVSPSAYRVDLFRDRNRTSHVGFGEHSSPVGTVAISEANASGLSGSLDISYTADTNTIELSVVPEFLAWRFRGLRALWTEQDWPTDAYSQGLLSVIDPDVIGPDDFRIPFAKTNQSAPDRAFDVWLRRRQWVDNRLAAFAGMTKTLRGEQVPDLAAMFAEMNQPVAYAGTTVVQRTWEQSTQPNDFDALLDTLTRGTDDVAVKDARERIEQDLNLTIESFTRLMTIRAKDQQSTTHSQSPPVTEDEWREVFSILTQAQKGRLFSAWREEERNRGIVFGPREFWSSLREPVEDEWPPVIVAQHPFIDPEVLKLTDLPEPVAGNRAIALWEDRKAELDQIRDDIEDAHEGTGFEAMLVEALGQPQSGQTWEQDLIALKNMLDSTNPADVESATARIANSLYLSLEDFNQLMIARAKEQNTDPTQKPTPAEWAQVYKVLTSARKRKREFSIWLSEEQNTTTGVVYWSALKARLPRWRATVEGRQTWAQALRLRSRMPIIDPNVVSVRHVKTVAQGAPAFDLWRVRRDWVNTRRQALKSAREAEATAQNGLDKIVQQTVGVSLVELQALDGERKRGNSIGGRLEQLSLTPDAFDYLLRVRDLLARGSNVLDSEWDDVYSILVQVEKRRSYAEWQAEERGKDLTLGPDYFKVPSVDTTLFPRSAPVEPPAWLASAEALRDWQDTLEARIDQHWAVVDAVQQAVSATEEATLPTLRDALINATNAPGVLLDQKAKWITDHLLMDAAADGCQQTTRVAQAIETVQGILWSVRIGLLTDTHPKLELVASRFDEEWKWIGSYATWRAAMFAFLYPENILLPSLRRYQTPGFRKLVDDLRSIRRLTPARARAAASAYATYFRDVCSLQWEGSRQAMTSMPGGERQLNYMFARGGETGTVYWSVHDPTDVSGYAQSFWEAVPGPGDVTEIVGLATYRPNPNAGARFLYLFAKTQKEGKQELLFVRYDLRNRAWQPEPTSLALPEKAVSFSAAIKERAGEDDPPRIIIRLAGGIFYERSLNREGRDWADGDWQPMDRWWKPWSRVDVGATKLPPDTQLAAVVRDPLSLHFFAVANNGLVSTIHFNGYKLTGQWGPLSPVPPSSFTVPVGSPVTGVYRDYGGMPQMDVFVVGSNHRVYTTRWSAIDGWASQWTEIGSTQMPPGLSKSAVTAVSRTPGSIDIFVPGLGTRVSQNLWNASSAQWGSWQTRMGGVNVPQGSVITAVSRSPAKLDLFAVDDEGLVVHEAWDHKTGWGQPTRIPNSVTVPTQSVVTAVARDKDSMDVFVTDSSGTVRSVRWKSGSGWGTWHAVGSIPGLATQKPIIRAVARNPNRVVLFVVSGGAVYTTWQDDDVNDGKWHPWSPIGDPAKDKVPNNAVVTAVATSWQHLLQFELKLLVVGQDGDIYWTESVEGVPSRSAPAPSFTWRPEVPASLSGFQLTEQLPEAERPQRAAQIGGAFQLSWFGRRSIQTYLEEAFYFAPVHLALQLQKSGEYLAALDWLRFVYDYTAPTSSRTLVGLAPQQTQADSFKRQTDWLLDPLNPHLIAETRPQTYKRFTLLSIIRCLLDYADAEFTQDTAESLPRARNLYTTVLELLDEPELKQTLGTCEDKIGNLNLTVGDPQWVEVRTSILNLLREIRDAKVLNEIVDTIGGLVNGGYTPEKFAEIMAIITRAKADTLEQPTFDTLARARATELPRLHTELLTQPTLAGTVEKVGTVIGDNFRRFVSEVSDLTPETLEREETDLPWLRDALPLPIAAEGSALAPGVEENGHLALFSVGSGADIFGPAKFIDDGYWLPAPSVDFCIPPNPVLNALRLRAHLNLYKLRTCRNIAGVERELEPYAAATDQLSGMPTIGVGGQLALPGAVRIQPTAYRYTTLIERAKQLVQLAVQTEAAFLSTLEKIDKEAYDLLRARADVRLAQAGVRLQDLRVKEAQGGVKLAELQRGRVQLQADYFQQLLDQDLLEEERQSLAFMHLAATLQYSVAASSAAIGAGYLVAAGIMQDPKLLLQAYQYLSSGATTGAQAYSTSASILATYASYARRKEEWAFQKSLADHDKLIGDQQVWSAEDRVRVVEQERVIEQMRADHTQEVLDFLSNKFTNKELYDWMSGILERVYGFFLQQATAMAQLAANQLAFERQEPAPPFIQADYWEAPADEDATSVAGERAADRRGLTGSARLLQDIYQLDQYALETAKRKQQLTRTISLAQLDPFTFQRFQQTGVMTFATPMELFDRDFPGHYLRLVKKVRMSVVALIPPTQGIRATLSSSGISRVVIGDDIFQKVVVRRSPETIALSSPANSTGLFELEQQPDMLFPFEGMGVDTVWEFRMPRSANPFDYRTIADVLITIEYTALDSFNYRQEVIQSLPSTLSAERAFSFRHQFADAWYDLHNPEQIEVERQRMVVGFTTDRADFPPNVEDLTIQEVTLYFASANGQSFEVPVTHLHFREQESTVDVGGEATSIDGVISTRRGNAGSWGAMRTKKPFGEWELALPNTEAIRNRFKEEEIEDILFVITYSGRTPEWPT